MCVCVFFSQLIHISKNYDGNQRGILGWTHQISKYTEKFTKNMSMVSNDEIRLINIIEHCHKSRTYIMENGHLYTLHQQQQQQLDNWNDGKIAIV